MIKLYNHQETALAILETEKSFALFWKPGCGKTLPILLHIVRLYKANRIRNALVVAPKAVMGAWVRDISKLPQEDQEIAKRVVTVVNYDLVWRRDDFAKEWDFIALDESHYIKDRMSRRADFLLRLSLSATYRYILTGTPVGNKRLEDIWAQFAFLAPTLKRHRIASEWLGTYKEFTDFYCVLNLYFKPFRYRNVSGLQKIIEQHSYSLSKEEALDLPEQLPDELYEIDLKESKKYRLLATESAVPELDVVTENPLTKLAKLRQICSGFLIDDQHVTHELLCDKQTVFSQFIEAWESKLVIFAEFKFSILKICEILKRKKRKYVRLDGEQPDKSIWKQFQEDPTIQCIVCQYQSANAGIDLFAADTTLYYEPTISGTVLEQSRCRTHRIGQKQPCTYIHLLTKGTVEEAIYKTVVESEDFNDRLFAEYIDDYQRSFTR